MKLLRSLAVLGFVTALITTPAFADKKAKKSGDGPAGKHEQHDQGDQDQGNGHKDHHKFTASEREAIQGYVKERSEPKKGGKKGKGLPPGLQKKVARGGELPPGWRKKVVVGEILPVEVYQECHPLPPEVVVKLPAPPGGVITVTIGGKVVRLLEATREILDVFDVLPK